LEELSWVTQRLPKKAKTILWNASLLSNRKNEVLPPIAEKLLTIFIFLLLLNYFTYKWAKALNYNLFINVRILLNILSISGEAPFVSTILSNSKIS
jgi:hypothetical protein